MISGTSNERIWEFRGDIGFLPHADRLRAGRGFDFSAVSEEGVGQAGTLGRKFRHIKLIPRHIYRANLPIAMVFKTETFINSPESGPRSITIKPKIRPSHRTRL